MRFSAQLLLDDFLGRVGAARSPCMWCIYHVPWESALPQGSGQKGTAPPHSVRPQGLRARSTAAGECAYDSSRP